MVTRIFCITLVFSLFITGCKQEFTGKIDKIVIGVSAGDDPTEKLDCFKTLIPYFKKEFEVSQVDIFVASNYTSIIEAMRTKKVDVAHFGELAYILAAERAGAEAFAMAGTTQEIRYTNSTIITSSKSNIKTMTDVIERSHELSIAFSDPASTSGHLYPRNYLNSIGLEPEKSFKSVSFTSDNYTSILTAISQKVDMACTYSLALNRLIKKGKMKESDYVVLWQSQPYVSSPISLRGDLPSGLKEKIKQAYYNLAKKEPVIWENFKNKIYIMYPEEILKELQYVPAHDSLYNESRKVAKNCKGFNLNIKN